MGLTLENLTKHYRIRPENIYEGGDIPLKITLNENLGQTTLVHGLIQNKHITCKFKRWANFKANDVIKVGFDKGKIHFFDKESTAKIC